MLNPPIQWDNENRSEFDDFIIGKPYHPRFYVGGYFLHQSGNCRMLYLINEVNEDEGYLVSFDLDDAGSVFDMSEVTKVEIFGLIDEMPKR